MENKPTALPLLIRRLCGTRPVLKQQGLSNNHRPLLSDEERLKCLSASTAAANALGGTLDLQVLNGDTLNSQL